jgi:hypothetical protein
VPYAFEARGPFELKGLPGSRTLYAVVANPESSAS